jgi:putative transposase
VLRVSRSGYYAWCGRLPSRRAQQEERLVEHIRSIHRGSDGTYGSPRLRRASVAHPSRIRRASVAHPSRLHKELREQGTTTCGRNRVAARLMRKHAISAQPVKRLVITTDSRHDLPVAQNLLGQDLGASEADTRWSGDITYVWYIWTGEGWLYLSVVLDLFPRRVVGGSMRPTLENGGAGHQRPGDGALAAQAQTRGRRADLSQRPRQPVRQRRLPDRLGRCGNHPQHESARQLL